MRSFILIISLLFFSCDSSKKKLITINSDFSIQELPFDHTSDQDFEKFIKQNNTAFTLTTYTPADYQKQAEGFELCGNDSQLYTYHKIYTNESLGMVFKFSKYEHEPQYQFSKYEINKPEFIQISTLASNQFNKNQLNAFHITVEKDYAYVTQEKFSVIDIEFKNTNDSIKSLSRLSVLK